mgnify:CR=1 FL=1
MSLHQLAGDEPNKKGGVCAQLANPPQPPLPVDMEFVQLAWIHSLFVLSVVS